MGNTPDKVTIAGKDYVLDKFTESHLGSLLYAFQRGLSPSGMSDFGENLKQIFIPTISLDLIQSRFDNENQKYFYKVFLTFAEMGEVMEQIIAIAKERGIINTDEMVDISIEIDDEPPVVATRKLKANK